ILQGDWSSDVCSSDLLRLLPAAEYPPAPARRGGLAASRAAGDQVRRRHPGQRGGLRAAHGGRAGLLAAERAGLDGSARAGVEGLDRKSTRLNSSHLVI